MNFNHEGIFLNTLWLRSRGNVDLAPVDCTRKPCTRRRLLFIRSFFVDATSTAHSGIMCRIKRIVPRCRRHTCTLRPPPVAPKDTPHQHAKTHNTHTAGSTGNADCVAADGVRCGSRRRRQCDVGVKNTYGAGVVCEPSVQICQRRVVREMVRRYYLQNESVWDGERRIAD